MIPEPRALQGIPLVTRRLSFGPYQMSLEVVADNEALLDAVDVLDDDERLPYWAELWPSAVALARYLGRLDEPLPWATAVELGAGYGLPSLMAALRGLDVVALDYYHASAALLAVNAARNGLTARGAGRLVSLCADHRQLPLETRFDLVLAADVVYERRFFAPVADAMEALVAPGGVAILTEPGRELSREFFPYLDERGWERTSTVEAVELDGLTSRVGIHVLRGMVR